MIAIIQINLTQNVRVTAVLLPYLCLLTMCDAGVCVCVGEELKHMSTSKDGRRRSEKRKPLYEVNLRCWSRKKRIGEEKKMSVTSQAKSQSLKKVQ